MRLFIAIEFPEEIKAQLETSLALVRSACVRGTFTRRENFHLTLVFLGETASSRAQDVIRLMDACLSPPIPLTIGHMGRFKHREGDILLRQIKADNSLFHLQRALESGLRALGFPIEVRQFTPHLTLSRRAVLKEGIMLRDLSAKMPELTYTAVSMTLMQSTHIDGRLTYTPLHRTALNAAGNDP